MEGALVTLARLAAAFLLAAGPAVALGLAMGLWRPVRSAVEPYVALLYPLPKIALLPLLLIVLGVGEPAFVVTGAITAFFQIALSTAGGVQSLDPRLIEVGRNYGARGVRLFRKIILPGALPAIFTGLRLGLGLALVTVIVVEFVTAKSGLGHLVYRHWQMLITAEMYGAFVLVGALGLVLTRGLRRSSAARWPGHRRKGSSHENVARHRRRLAGRARRRARRVGAGQPTVKIGYIPSDSFAVLFLLADRHLPPAGINVQIVRLPGGAEITTQVATGQLQIGGAGMGAAGFNAVAAGLPVEFVAPLHSGYLEDYFAVRKALWGKEVKRIADLKGRPVALNTRGAAVEWMLDLVLRRDGLTIKDVQVKIMPFPDMVPALESGAVDAAILTEPFPTLAEDKGVGVRPLTRPASAKPVPITATFWNAEWAEANGDLANRVMVGYLQAARDLAADGWQGDEDARRDRQVHAGQARGHQEGAAARGRPEPRDGRLHARQHAEAQRRPRLPEVQGAAARRQALQLRLPRPRGAGAGAEVIERT